MSLTRCKQDRPVELNLKQLLMTLDLMVDRLKKLLMTFDLKVHLLKQLLMTLDLMVDRLKQIPNIIHITEQI